VTNFLASNGSPDLFQPMNADVAPATAPNTKPITTFRNDASIVNLDS